MRSICLGTGVVALLALQVACDDHAWAGDLEHLATQAISEETLLAEKAIAQLREHGPAGLEALLTVHAAAIKQVLDQKVDESDHAWQRIRRAIDEVGGQRDGHASRLFWYTDLGQATAAAEKAGKPIISLRLLGKLTDEYSCANSRFFRTTLYPNAKIGRILRERFVLHWHMVRPVPIVTIDFGDGRKLIRTAAGNSAHYVLTPDGRPLDALPGLYGPQAFLTWLARVDELAQAVLVRGVDKAALVVEYHARQKEELSPKWNRDLKEAGFEFDSTQAVPPPSQDTSDAIWNRIAKQHTLDSELDAASRRLIASRNPIAAAAGRRAVTKSVSENPLVRLIRDLQGTIAIDTVRNEYVLHRQIHEWFATRQVGQIEALNERVYAELFLTPRSDPWLGLLPSGYSALENEGVVVAAQR